MKYDITIPFKVGLFTLVAAYLIVYFLWLVDLVRKNRDKKDIVVIALIHMIIMISGLLLTGFASNF